MDDQPLKIPPMPRFLSVRPLTTVGNEPSGDLPSDIAAYLDNCHAWRRVQLTVEEVDVTLNIYRAHGATSLNVENAHGGDSPAVLLDRAVLHLEPTVTCMISTLVLYGIDPEWDEVYWAPISVSLSPWKIEDYQRQHNIQQAFQDQRNKPHA